MDSKSVFLALIPLFILGGVVYYLMGPGTDQLFTGEPLPDIIIEHVEFKHGQVIAHVRNAGQDTVTIAMADINGRPLEALVKPTNVLPRLATAQVIMQYQWTEPDPVEIGITASDGLRFSFEVEAVALTPEPDLEQLSYFALLGAYVGVVPVMIGLLWFPFMSRISKKWYSFFLSLTAGLLIFLAVDALSESFEATERVANAFRGEVLIVVAAVSTVLVLMMFTDRITTRTVTTGTMSVSTKQFSGLYLSYMVAIGIGLHNLGEGLAIGAAVALGAVALTKFLVVGFAIHNTTEGLAIIAPIAKQKARILHLLALGMIAGVPIIAGTWIGAFTFMPIVSIAFLAIGAGAIFQVVYAIFHWMKKDMGSSITAPHNVAGFIFGLLIMYFTALLIAG